MSFLESNKRQNRVFHADVFFCSEACFVEPKRSKTFKVPLFTHSEYGEKKGPGPATWPPWGCRGVAFFQGFFRGLGGCERLAMALLPGVQDGMI